MTRLERTNRREYLASAVGLVTVGITGCLGGNNKSNAEYPSDEITSIANAEGGGFDAYSRIFAPYWEEELPNNPTVVVDNIPGGSGLNAMVQNYRSDPNGHTIGIWDIHHVVTNQIGRDNPGYDVREMSHIGAVTQSPFSIISMNRTGIETWEDLQNQVGSQVIATAGAGGMPHTSWILLAEITGFVNSTEDLQFVHYDGSSGARGALERGEADLFMVSASSGARMVEAIDASMLVCFADDPDSPAGKYFEDVAENYTPEIDEENIEEFSQLAVFRRFFTGPPDVPSDILEIQRETLSEMTSRDDLVKDAEEGGRPIINPADHETVEENLSNGFSIMEQDAIRERLQEVM